MIERLPTSCAYEYRMSSVFGIGKEEENAVRGTLAVGLAVGGCPIPRFAGRCPGRRWGGFGGYACEASFAFVLTVVPFVPLLGISGIGVRKSAAVVSGIGEGKEGVEGIGGRPGVAGPSEIGSRDRENAEVDAFGVGENGERDGGGRRS